MLNVKKYKSKRLDRDNLEDIKNLQKLCEECKEWFILTGEKPPKKNKSEKIRWRVLTIF